MNSYTFEFKGVVLSDIKAKTEKEAWELLPIHHRWINATAVNSNLVRVIENVRLFDERLDIKTK